MPTTTTTNQTTQIQSILEDADTLQQYLTASEQPTYLPPSPESTASTVKSSVAQSMLVNTPFLFSAPATPETQFASGSQAITLPPPEVPKPATPTAKPPPATKPTKAATTKPGTHKLPRTIAPPTCRNTVCTTQRSTQPSPTIIPDTFTPSNRSTAMNIPGPSQTWDTLMDDDQISNFSSKCGHDDNDGFILVRKTTKPVKPHSGKCRT